MAKITCFVIKIMPLVIAVTGRSALGRPIGITIAIEEKRYRMDSPFKKFSAAQLRSIIINEMRKFALALEYGSTISDLQEIREHIKLLADTLAAKEKAEFWPGIVETSPQP